MPELLFIQAYIYCEEKNMDMHERKKQLLNKELLLIKKYN